MNAQPTKRVAIIGGGIVGAFAAYHLTRLGCQVTVVGQMTTGNGASWRSLAWLNAAAAVTPEYHQLKMLSLNRYHQLEAIPAMSKAINFVGALAWDGVESPAEAVQGSLESERIVDSYHRLRALSHQVSLLSREEAGRVDPLLKTEQLPEDGILFAADEGWVELASLISELLSQVAATDGNVVIDGTAQIRTAQGRAIGVELAEGTLIAADAVLVAAGPETPAILAAVGVEIATSSSFGAVLITEPTPVRPRVLVRGPVGSVRADAFGSIRIHSTLIEATAHRHENGQISLDSETVQYLLSTVAGMYKGLDSLVLQRAACGTRPIPGDGMPMIGAVDDLPQCFVAFTHSGATLGPILGELIASEIAFDAFTNPQLDTFRPARLTRAGSVPTM